MKNINKLTVVEENGSAPWIQDKIARARAHAAVLTRLVDKDGRPVPAKDDSRARLSYRFSDDRSEVDLTPDCSLALFRRLGDLYEERREFGTGWMLLEVAVRGKRKLAFQLRTDNPDAVELLEFVPGHWKTWFGGNPGNDATPYRKPIVPKKLSELDPIRRKK